MLEAAGIPTVIIGSARDIVEECGVARFVFVDFPLGNPCGRPWDPDGQREIVRMAVELLQAAPAPRTTVQSARRWTPDPGEDAAWRARFMYVGDDNREALVRLGDERRANRAARSAAGRVRGS